MSGKITLGTDGQVTKVCFLGNQALTPVRKITFSWEPSGYHKDPIYPMGHQGGVPFMPFRIRFHDIIVLDFDLWIINIQQPKWVLLVSNKQQRCQRCTFQFYREMHNCVKRKNGLYAGTHRESQAAICNRNTKQVMSMSYMCNFKVSSSHINKKVK